MGGRTKIGFGKKKNDIEKKNGLLKPFLCVTEKSCDFFLFL